MQGEDKTWLEQREIFSESYTLSNYTSPLQSFVMKASHPLAEKEFDEKYTLTKFLRFVMVHEFGHLTRDVMSTSDQLGEPMKKRTRPTFSPEFRLEASQLVIDQNYTVIAAAKAINLGISTMAKWVAQLKQERQGKPLSSGYANDP